MRPRLDAAVVLEPAAGAEAAAAAAEGFLMVELLLLRVDFTAAAAETLVKGSEAFELVIGPSPWRKGRIP